MPANDLTDWPVLTRYDQDHLARIALPLGGIGTGTVSLGGRGDLRDWEIVNRPAKGFAPEPSFFALYTRPAGGKASVTALEGQIDPSMYEGSHGSPVPIAGLPRFRDCSFQAAYPFGQVLLSDPDVPLDVRIQAFNPLVPGDSDSSGIPVAVIRFVLTNNTSRSVFASVCGTVRNFIGTDGTNGSPSRNVNELRKTEGQPGVQGVFMRSEGVDPKAEQHGTIALATTARRGVTYRTAWPRRDWWGSLLDFWDDFSHDGKLEAGEEEKQDDPLCSVAAAVRVPPQGTRTVTFLLAWHFPNRQTWTPAREGVPSERDEHVDANRVGNYYATQYTDAWDAAASAASRLRILEAETLTFVRSLCDSDLPDVVKEAALFNLSTLRSQTCFRTEDGHFFGWEGTYDDRGCCSGSCTHVWNYEQTTAFLFGDLARSMREVEFSYSTRDDGHMSFRAFLPLARATDYGIAAADGQMGCLMKLYRDWQLSGDDEMLRRLWPKARKALEFCWIPGGWDADRDGVMEGVQHNTMDVEYYGPNPQMGGWYLGALRAAEEMARYLGDGQFADTCHDLFVRGSQWMDANLFNGDYYEHQIKPASSDSAIADGLRHGGRPDDVSAKFLESTKPLMQLGAGCLVDQLVGQYMAHVCGLGYLLDKAHVRKTLRSLMKYNFQPDFFDFFNDRHGFVIGGESGMVMATYPKGRRPVRPFPFYNIVMTGFEYTTAVHMLYEGHVEDGLKCIDAVRSRYDGLKRSPFDEAECGHHYARAMASWAALLALTGFRYSAVTKSVTFGAAEGRSKVFWSNGSAWGTCLQTPTQDGVDVELAVLHGSLSVRRLTLDGVGSVENGRPKTIRKGQPKSFHVGN